MQCYRAARGPGRPTCQRPAPAAVSGAAPQGRHTCACVYGTAYDDSAGAKLISATINRLSKREARSFAFAIEHSVNRYHRFSLTLYVIFASSYVSFVIGQFSMMVPAYEVLYIGTLEYEEVDGTLTALIWSKTLN